MKERNEFENKYLITSTPNNDYWDRHVLIYQFFLNIKNNESEQLKIVFNFKTYKVNAIIIKKQIISKNESFKQTAYLDLNDINYDGLIGIHFVMKIRHIKEPFFLDKYIRSKASAPKYILEIETPDVKEYYDNFGKLTCVSGMKEYLNENLAIQFCSNDMEYMNKLMELFI